MANITKRVNKRAAAHLAPERAEVALLCEMKGMLGVGLVPATLATLPTALTMRRNARKRLDEQGGLASTFPRSTSAAVAVTATRVVAMPSGGLKFKPPTMEIDRGAVRAELGARRGVGKRLVLTFADGSQVEVDVMPGQPLSEFLAALGATSTVAD